MLLEYFKPFLLISRIDYTSFSMLFIFDSTTIGLFLDVMKGVGLNPKNDGKKKGDLKIHMMIDGHSGTPEFVKISKAKRHDKTFLKDLNLDSYSMIVLVRAYNHFF